MDLVSLLVWLGVLVIVVIAGWYVLSQMTLPEPLNKIVMVVVVVVVAIIAVALLLHLTGAGALKIG